MPELPDITLYVEALEQRILRRPLQDIRLNSPFLLRTADPPISISANQPVTALRRIGKRIAIGLANDHWLVLHLMIAGRLHWKKPGATIGGRNNLAAFDFAHGSLTLTEAGSQRRASLHFVRDPASLDPGGVEPLDVTLDQFAGRLTLRNHTLKRALTDPRLFSGIGNAYSDEILHHAKLSPIGLTQKLTRDQVAILYEAVRQTLITWTNKLREEAKGNFPENVTAFRPDMAVHGKFKQPCPVCRTKVQRIRYASNETNYCPRCQTNGKLLADRALSRLLGEDWVHHNPLSPP